MTGYSGARLDKKLGLMPGQSIIALHTPPGYGSLLPDYVGLFHKAELTGAFDWLHAFYDRRSLLQGEFAELKAHLKPAGQLWISWPKKSSGVQTDLDENIIRELGLKQGLVDVKVAAIDEIWSGLKFVFRLSDR